MSIQAAYKNIQGRILAALQVKATKSVDSIAKRRCFTLLEMLLVIFLMGLFLGLIGINVNKAVHEQRFRSEVGMVVDTLRIAQNIMLILDNDVHVKFKKEEDSISMHIETSCPLSKNWGKLILAPKQLRTIHIVDFKDRRLDQTAKSGSVDIRFLSSGYVMSQGIMRLSTAEASGGKTGLESFICLSGYPAALTSSEQRPSEPACFSLLEEGFIESLTNQTMSEIKSFQAAESPQKEDNAPKEDDSKEKGKSAETDKSRKSKPTGVDKYASLKL